MIVKNVLCDEYNTEKIGSAVKEAIDGLDVQFERGSTILLKANLVAAHAPEDMATTHPMVVSAVAKYLLERGAKVIIGDSPGSVYTKARLKSVYEATRMTDAAADSGAALNDDFSTEQVTFENGVSLKRFETLGVAQKVDYIVNAAKYKTHGFTGYTCAVKNMYGIIPGLKKVEYHATHSDLNKFSDLMIDLQEYYKPKMLFHIADAVWGMEGAGPTAGKPKKIGNIVASVCPYSLDYVLLDITCNDYRKMPMITRAIERGLFLPEEVEVIGASVQDNRIEDYDNVELVSNQPLKKIPVWLQGTLFRMCSQRPVIKKSKCKGCQKCFVHCPPKAITMSRGKAVVDLDKCIRCFCCQELCPFQVVKIKTPVLAKLFTKLSGKRKK